MKERRRIELFKGKIKLLTFSYLEKPDRTVRERLLERQSNLRKHTFLVHGTPQVDGIEADNLGNGLK